MVSVSSWVTPTKISKPGAVDGADHLTADLDPSRGHPLGDDPHQAWGVVSKIRQNG